MRLEIFSNMAQCHKQLLTFPLNKPRAGPAITCILYVNGDRMEFSFLNSLSHLKYLQSLFLQAQEDATNVKCSVIVAFMISKTGILFSK